MSGSGILGNGCGGFDGGFSRRVGTLSYWPRRRRRVIVVEVERVAATEGVGSDRSFRGSLTLGTLRGRTRRDTELVRVVDSPYEAYERSTSQ